ncbi:MAG: Unknown protein [uncultured Thiotrichaceae bacterium]|uniref:Uncharacterized protein n=1 Tax=uncultured Thiotrichaceae bacterium TaxID=298394 RepID=A0A6S6SYM5_9GAMM|nr:MAG: Unknown protein [uncultured Thiotrichaceae bacterium]
MLSFTRNILTLTIVCVCLSASITKQVSAEEFDVSLIATIDDGPALESVEWTVYRNGNETFKQAKRHLARLKMPAGTYKAVARLVSDRSVVRSRNFLVRNDTRVVIPMD